MIEPFPGLRIDFNSDRRYLEAVSSYYIADYNGNFPDSTRNQIISGNFSISIISWGTSFEKISKDRMTMCLPHLKLLKKILLLFRNEGLKKDRELIPDMIRILILLTGEPVEGPYKSGYGPTSREVLIPAFLAAYTKSSPNKVDT